MKFVLRGAAYSASLLGALYISSAVMQDPQAETIVASDTPRVQTEGETPAKTPFGAASAAEAQPEVPTPAVQLSTGDLDNDPAGQIMLAALDTSPAPAPRPEAIEEIAEGPEARPSDIDTLIAPGEEYASRLWDGPMDSSPRPTARPAGFAQSDEIAPLLADDVAVTRAGSLEPVSEWRVVDANRVNMRGGPSTRYSVVDLLTNGERVRLVGGGLGGWAQIRLEDSGRIGWISERYLAMPTEG